jgi:hypothetical protein
MAQMPPTTVPSPTPTPMPMPPSQEEDGTFSLVQLLKRLFGFGDKNTIPEREAGKIRPGIGSDTELAYRELMDPDFRPPMPTPTPRPY